MTFDDSYIEHWGEIFLANPWLRRFCKFEQFLAAPHRFVDDGPGGQSQVMPQCRCLLPYQRAIQQRLDGARRSA